MQTAPPLLSIFLIGLIYLTGTNALCNLENGTVVRCHELEDVKYIETYDLESLKASVADSILGPGLFTNLSTLRHLDLSNGDLKRIEPGTFRELRDLKSLDLADNKIEYLELASLDGLNQLRSLNLRKNNLRQLPPVLVRLKNLRHLDVQGNPFQCNCATLRVRDLLSKRGVKMSKKVICAGPSNMKGTSLLKPEASVICAFEEQDKEMQKDQPEEGSGDHDKDDPWDEYDEETEAETPETHKSHEIPETSKEHVEIETPSPESAESQSPSSVETADPTKEIASKETAHSTSTIGTLVDKVNEEDEPFFDNEDTKDHSNTSESPKKEEIKDVLFYPVEGSGDEEDEGSGEGSGTKDDWFHEDIGSSNSEPSTTSGESLIDIILGVFWSTTATPEIKKDPDLEEEQFLDASSSKTPVIEDIVTTKAATVEATSSTTSAIIIDSSEVNDMSKSGKVKAELNDELAEVSSATQSKKGMGSYVVLAALLVVLAALIVFAAYKGDFCRKKRKRDDVENGTEMKDMRKPFLDGGNSTQPKIASAKNGESAPLVTSAPDDDTKDTKITNDRQIPNDTPKAPNGISDHADPIKPPRKLYNQSDDPRLDEDSRGDSNSFKDDSVSARTSPVEPSSTSTTVNNGTTARHPEINGPPLSPGAQRVKITLQENPDSVPRTPILITRTIAGENLVKTP